MLVERVFSLGGILCLGAGVSLLVFEGATGILLSFPELGLPGALFLLFGGLFLYVGKEAHQERLKLLKEGETGIPPPVS